MAEKNIIIEIGGREVSSHIEHDPAAPGHQDVIRIVSTCDGHVHHASLAISHRPGYSMEQAEYDLEQARFASAEKAAGKAHIRQLVPQLIQSADAPKRLSAPSIKRPKVHEINVSS